MIPHQMNIQKHPLVNQIKPSKAIKGTLLPWGSTLNIYFRDEGDLGLYWTVERDLALVLVLVLMLVLMLVLVSVWVLK